jgi:hypothetical protein
MGSVMDCRKTEAWVLESSEVRDSVIDKANAVPPRPAKVDWANDA